jgi:predicted DNA-binding protein (MmcQ/YjbR family)
VAPSLDQVLNLFGRHPGAADGYPFGPGALVFKTGGKMFGLIAEDARPLTVTLKCDPDLAMELRAQYPAVQPGYHFNKQHWNTITLDGSLPSDELAELIEHSYQLVVAGLPRSVRDQLPSLPDGPS